MQKEKRLVPRSRFPEFEEDWRAKKLGNISKFYKGKGLSKSEIDENGVNECIRYGELYTIYNELIDKVVSRTNVSLDVSILSEKNDVIIPSSGETQLDIATASCVLKEGIILGGDLNIIRSQIEGVFLAYLLNNNKKIDIAKLAQGNSVVHLYNRQLATLLINIPSNEEQRKIANFLNSIDNRVQNLEKKKSLLELYKKGLMDRIFKQEIRFRDDDGNEFQNWGKKSLSDICDIVKGKQLNKEELTEFGTYPCQNGGISHSGFTEEFNTPENTITISEGGNSCGYVNFLETKFWSGGHCYSLLKLKKEIIVTFLFQYLKFNENMIMRLRVGSGLPNIQKKAIATFKVQLPAKEEQTKIANFLSAIDTKINLVDEQIDKTKIYKKGLLQQMFV